MATIKMRCVFCGNAHAVTCSDRGYNAWASGELIQVAMPELSATEREQLISQICPTCQDKFFDDEEED